MDRIKFHDKEWIMGDPAYWSAPHCLAKFPMKKMCPLFHEPLPDTLACNCPKGRLPFEKTFTTVFDGYRGRVEKIFSQLLHHRLFKGTSALTFVLTLTLFSSPQANVDGVTNP